MTTVSTSGARRSARGRGGDAHAKYDGQGTDGAEACREVGERGHVERAVVAGGGGAGGCVEPSRRAGGHGGEAGVGEVARDEAWGGEVRGLRCGLPALCLVVGQVDDHRPGGARVSEQPGQAFGAVPMDGIPVGHDDGRPQASGMLHRAQGAGEDVSTAQGAAVGGLDDGPVEAGVMVGEADLEQVGAGPGDLGELMALGAGRMQSGGDEHAERAAGLGEEGLEGVGGGQEMSFSGGLSRPVSGGVGPVKAGRLRGWWRSGRGRLGHGAWWAGG